MADVPLNSLVGGSVTNLHDSYLKYILPPKKENTQIDFGKAIIT